MDEPARLWATTYGLAALLLAGTGSLPGSTLTTPSRVFVSIVLLVGLAVLVAIASRAVQRTSAVIARDLPAAPEGIPMATQNALMAAVRAQDASAWAAALPGVPLPRSSKAIDALPKVQVVLLAVIIAASALLLAGFVLGWPAWPHIGAPLVLVTMGIVHAWSIQTTTNAVRHLWAEEAS